MIEALLRKQELEELKEHPEHSLTLLAIEASKVQGILAKLTHVGLYAVMILMPVSGYVAWFGGVEAAAKGHNVLKIVLLALVALHVVGALYHQFVLRDGTLARMRRAQG